MGGYVIKIYNFNEYLSSGISYGGHGGSKKGIIINGEKWFLKYPKSTKSMQNVNLSYTTMPISEYLGSQIYKTIGIEVHETKLGITNDKIVVACKDFLNSTEMILDYNSIKNEYDEIVEKKLEILSSSSLISNQTDLEEVLVLMENNPYFKKIPNLKIRFWDMFIIDAFINNNDRNEGNWGLILDKANGNLRITPVFDNGASFYNKSSNEKLNELLNDEYKFKQAVYESSISVFRVNGKLINPLKYIESLENEDCNQAILRIVPNINLSEISKIFNEVPEEIDGIQVLSKKQKDLYLNSLEYRYNNVLLPIYNKLSSK